MDLKQVLKKIVREFIRLFHLSEETQCLIMSLFWEEYKDRYNILTRQFSIEEIDRLFEVQKLYPKNILSSEETIEDIIKNKKSISRIGDGEEMGCHILCDNPGFPVLKQRLIEILEHGSDDKCLVCLNNLNFFDKSVPIFYRRHFGIYWLKQSIEKLLETVKFNTSTDYGDAYSISFYFGENDSKEVRKQKLDNVKSIWEGKKILFVVSKKSKILNDKKYFSNALQKEFIFAPAEWAFQEYDTILKQITENYSNDWIVYLELGSCATVLSFDLSRLGYQALDMGDYYGRTVLSKASKGLV